jgi:hypothetical protein
MKKLSINYLRCYDIPMLERMAILGKQDSVLIKKVLQEKYNRLNNISESLEYHI